MDIFMDKFSQKKNAQEMIQANTAADTAKMQMLQRQVAEYDGLLQDMRKVNLKAAENMELMQKAIQSGIQKIEAIQNSDEEQIGRRMEELSAAIKEQMESFSLDMKMQAGEISSEAKKQAEESLEIKKQIEELSAAVKKQKEELATAVKKQTDELATAVKQQMDELSAAAKQQAEDFPAAVKKQVEELSAASKKQAEEFSSSTKEQIKGVSSETKKQIESLSAETKKQMEDLSLETKKQIEEAFDKSNDFLHKENVKVYRNVQAAVIEELNKQTDTLVAKQKEMESKQKALLPVSVIIMLLVLVDMFIRLFNIVIPI